MERGGEGWLGFADLWSGQKPWWNWYLTPVVNFGGPEDSVSQIHSPHHHVGVPGIFSDLLSTVQMLKRERESGVWKAMGRYRTNSIPGKTAALVPEFEVKDLSLGRTLWWWWYYRQLLRKSALHRQHFNIEKLGLNTSQLWIISQLFF